LSVEKLHEVIGKPNLYTQAAIQEALHDLRCDYIQQQRPLSIDTVDEGYLLRTRPEYAEYILNLYSEKPTVERLSSAALEVLSIVAYRGPVTRSEVEALRGVDSTGSVISLLERHLIQAVGRRETIGRPTLYSVTPRFFTYFGIDKIQSLPLYTELSLPPRPEQEVLPLSSSPVLQIDISMGSQAEEEDLSKKTL
jgi:segregation and condensation protein B